MEEKITEIQNKLFDLQDLKYKEFHCKLMPTVEKENVIGVRTPILRKLAKEITKTKEQDGFLKILPHKYYEENNLHGFIIEEIKDFDAAINEIDKFLPYIDNWATCDLISPKIFKKNTDKLYENILIWIKSDKTYTVRFAIKLLLSFYLDEHFDEKHLQLVSTVQSDEYYINMIIAWYFATALAKQYEATLPYIENKKLATWTNNKTIQKAIESYRITNEQKDYLRTLKIK